MDYLKKMVRFSNMAYCNRNFVNDCYNNRPIESKPENQSLQKCICENLVGEPFFFDSSESGYFDSQVYICNTKANELLVCCRGTESTSDVISDLKAWKNDLYDIYYHNNFTPHRKSLGMPSIHSGFNDQYNTIKFIIYHKVYEYLLTEPEKPTVIFTGHSLGGALATIAAACMAVQFSNRKNLDIQCYTFGSPRVGNKAFVKIFDKFVGRSERIVNELDPVPMIPRITGYHHVRGLQHITEEEEQGEKKYNIFDFSKPYDRFNSFLFKIFKVVWYSSTDNHSLSEYEERLESCVNGKCE